MTLGCFVALYLWNETALEKISSIRILHRLIPKLDILHGDWPFHVSEYRRLFFSTYDYRTQLQHWLVDLLIYGLLAPETRLNKNFAGRPWNWIWRAEPYILTTRPRCSFVKKISIKKEN